MQIIEVYDNKKNKYLKNVVLDDGSCLTLPLYIFKKQHLQSGSILEEEDINLLKETVIRSKIQKKALDYLSKRVYGNRELFDKLIGFGFLEEDVEPVVEKYLELGYLNDAQFAHCYVHDALLIKKMPKKRIQYDLMRKGIAENLIEDALNEFGDQEYENLIDLIEKKLLNSKDHSKDTLQKIKIQFYRKGYPLNEINRAIEAVLEKE